MDDIFDLAMFDEYKEDNRREVKAAEGAFLRVCGKPILRWLTPMAG